MSKLKINKTSRPSTGINILPSYPFVIDYKKYTNEEYLVTKDTCGDIIMTNLKNGTSYKNKTINDLINNINSGNCIILESEIILS